MSDAYVECLVKHKRSIAGLVLKWILIAITSVFGCLGLIGGSMISTVIAIVTGIFAYIVNLKSKMEYEYLYFDKEITVDKIMNQTRRKRVEVFETSRIEIIAPFHSHQLDSYQNRQMKTTDYSIGEAKQPDERYVMYYNGVRRVILSPSPEFLKALRMVIPRKVFTD